MVAVDPVNSLSPDRGTGLNAKPSFVDNDTVFARENQRNLDRRTYKPVVEKAGKGLLSHVYEDGRLGCIQPIGAAPGVFTADSAYVFGTGAFLLAGSEIYQLAR